MEEALERQLIIERSKAAVKMSEEDIRGYYRDALMLEMPMLINYFVKEIVLYNDRIEIYFNSLAETSPDESQGFSFYAGTITIEDTTKELEMYVG